MACFVEWSFVILAITFWESEALSSSGIGCHSFGQSRGHQLSVKKVDVATCISLLMSHFALQMWHEMWHQHGDVQHLYMMYLPRQHPACIDRHLPVTSGYAAMVSSEPPTIRCHIAFYSDTANTVSKMNWAWKHVDILRYITSWHSQQIVTSSPVEGQLKCLSHMKIVHQILPRHCQCNPLKNITWYLT